MKTLEEHFEANGRNYAKATYAYIAERQNEKSMNQIKSEIMEEIKTSKRTPEEKKELAHTIIKIILEVLLQILTLGLPALTKHTILKH